MKVAEHTMFLDLKREKLVPENHKEARFLLVRKGSPLRGDLANKYKKQIAEFKPAKESKPKNDKGSKPGGDKGGKGKDSKSK